MENSGRFDLLSLFGKDQLNEIQGRLAKITGLGFVTVNYRGEPLTDYTRFCSFCQHFREDEELQKNCIASDAMSSIQAAISAKPLIYICPCGLMEIAIPIIVNGTYLGGFLCGQALCMDPPTDILRMKPSTDRIEFQNTLDVAADDRAALPVFPYQHFEDIADLVDLVITLLCESAIRQIENEQSLRDQIWTASFLEKSRQSFIAVVLGSDYSLITRTVSSFLDSLFEHFPDNVSARSEMVLSLARALDENSNITSGDAEKADCLKLYPLSAEHAQTKPAMEIWLAQIVDFHYRRNKASLSPMLEPVFQYINQHVHEELSLAKIVDKCSISQSYVSRLFRKHFQISVTDYIHLRKIQLAKDYLLFEHRGIADIAFLLGYNEYTYFSKVFKKYAGTTVQEYRRQTGC